MRKLSSIILLGCFCLYYFGYLIYFYAYQHSLNREWEESIWEELYDDSATEMREIPLSLPYMANQEFFQTTNLAMEVDGEFLRVVKQRYQNDTLQLIYIKDHQQQQLENQVNDWIRSITDQSPQNKQERNQLFAKLFPKDFMAAEIPKLKTAFIQNTFTRNWPLQADYADIATPISTPPPQTG
ncbi:hypothetical protein [Algoriphagus aquimarinus]|uniref:Uncharacterized protein n=1 Tax=Algoriphagus aquimarinus TaxID=237018 RepID=A0A5C7B4D9_9BACT|nr:hypothetical protein [Algoriphagus aquimarinus]TXE13455.1 hypothetical protein ESV85_05630 [Algoriphagus aquimarinus]